MKKILSAVLLAFCVLSAPVFAGVSGNIQYQDGEFNTVATETFLGYSDTEECGVRVNYANFMDFSRQNGQLDFYRGIVDAGTGCHNVGVFENIQFTAMVVDIRDNINGVAMGVATNVNTGGLLDVAKLRVFARAQSEELSDATYHVQLFTVKNFEVGGEKIYFENIVNTYGAHNGYDKAFKLQTTLQWVVHPNVQVGVQNLLLKFGDNPTVNLTGLDVRINW